MNIRLPTPRAQSRPSPFVKGFGCFWASESVRRTNLCCCGLWLWGFRLGAWFVGVEADICVLRGVCIGLRRRISDWIVPFSHLFGVLFMAFGALGTRAAYRQMLEHLAVHWG